MFKMCEDVRKFTEKQSSKGNFSKDLLYSEYTNNSAAEHVIELLEKEKKTKPEMLHEKSEVKNRCSKLLQLIEKDQEELNEKSPEECDIEVVDGNYYVDMDVTIINPLSDDVEDPVQVSNNLEFIDTTSESGESEDESEFSDGEFAYFLNNGNFLGGTECPVRKNKRRFSTLNDDETKLADKQMQYLRNLSVAQVIPECQLDSSSEDSESEFSGAEKLVSSQEYRNTETESMVRKKRKTLIAVIEDEGK